MAFKVHGRGGASDLGFHVVEQELRVPGKAGTTVGDVPVRVRVIVAKRLAA